MAADYKREFIDGYMELSLAEQWFPKVPTQIVTTVKRDVVDQDALFGFLESFRCQFLLQEVHLLVAQLGEVVQTGIFTVVVGLVFATIQHHDAGISPIESTVSSAAHVVEVLAEADGVGIADFVVTSNK